MTNDGGRANEPTSYGLRPPQPQPQPQHQPPQSQAQQQPPYQPHHGQPQPPQVPPQVAHGSPYQPTQANRHTPAEPDPSVGRLLGGRYRLVSRLGHGGMGTVWLAHDEMVDRDVAVKEPRVPEHLGAQERDTVHRRMRREASSAARIDHPSVVTMHDVVVEDDKPWIVMELVRGQSLADRLQEGTLDPREAARIGLDVLNALNAAHEAGVLHRDVKPDNVLLGRGDRVVLSDFGIAQVEGQQGLTETGAFVGSPEFISPERVLGQRPGPESDLWSLGVVLYAAVEGMSPYRRSNIPATLQAVLSAEPQMPARGSGAFGTIVMQLLRKDPAARPTAAEVRAVLESVARPPQLSPEATRLYQGAGTGGAASGSKWVPPVLHRNRPAQYGLGAGLLAVVLVAGLILFKPFAGDELPEGWEVRSEVEILDAKIAVPEEYRRSQESLTEDSRVTFRDPSGVFTVSMDQVQKKPDNEILSAEKTVWEKYYKDGGDNGTEIKEAEYESANSSFPGSDKAFENLVDFVPYSDSSEDPIRYRYHELIVPGTDEVHWRLRVAMPAEGDAVTDGEELFSTVVEHLEIESKYLP
ncbi:serine/threonine-protein kinase [Streptomyces sp. IB2014 016-6]|uniref:serine/threonine-protein kinase n=1 Tax=Streptomyces sp. IB2014 016-6 TaxID=2517818 RepID=UPI0011CAA3B3|nr:serine/threonine-protein kinase [Streptomyces sp. IB2014 016-6]TXL90265.1 serine/threonine protein kinase [Streptomyces sp. IB2014 016-6]